jgi:hypothetical protein
VAGDCTAPRGRQRLPRMPPVPGDTVSTAAKPPPRFGAERGSVSKVRVGVNDSTPVDRSVTGATFPVATPEGLRPYFHHLNEWAET